MPLTFLEIGQAVVNELGLPQSTFLANNSNTTARQLSALINRAGDELYQAHQWTVSQALAVINIGTPITTTGDVVAGSTTISNIPSTAGIVANYFAVTGDNIQISARVATVVDATTVTMDEEATATGVASDLIFARDTFAVPDEFKWFLNRTMWDRTNRWELIGPMSPQADEWQRSGIVTTGPRRRWRQVGVGPTNWRLWPPPTASGTYPATLVFEYESNTWARTVAGVGITKMTADDDYAVIDPQAIILSAKWRLWQAKGFNYTAMQAEYLDYVSRLSARDGGAPDLSLAKPMRANVLLSPNQVPDGYWPS